MTPTLSKDDWIEIAAALTMRIAELHVDGQTLTHPNDVACYEDWILHLTTILETIGDEGEAMWPKDKDA